MKKSRLLAKGLQRGLALLSTVLLALPGMLQAAEPINVAGVYEYDAKPDGVRKQMYLTLDFINGTPDFTQVFTEKESSFKRLPKDFMNAKKLSRSFSGTRAPGYGKYKEKFLFSSTEEFKITNPRLEDGIIIANWTNANGDKGECRMVVDEDRSLRILGLTNLTRDFSPDGIEIGLVEDRLPQGATPFVSPKEAIDYFMGEYEKSLVTPKVTPFDSEMETKVVDATQNGNTIEVKLKMKNMSNYDALNVVVGDRSQDRTFAMTKDGRKLTAFTPKTPGSVGGTPAVQAKKGEWVEFSIIFEGVDEKVDYLSSMEYDNYLAGGFFMDNHITKIENIPVHQIRPKVPANRIASGAGSTSNTVKIKFDVVPPVWNTVAATAADKSINIRKTPSSTAARPVVDEMKINDFQVPVKYFAEWTTVAPKGDKYALMFEPGEYAPILKEESGWYELQGIGAKGDNGWVSAQFCKKYDLTPITRDDLKGDYKVYLSARSTYVIGIQYEEMDNYACFSFGRLENGIVVFPYSLYMEVVAGDSWRIFNGEGGYVLQVAKQDCDQYGVPDMKKVPTDVIDVAVAVKEALPTPFYLCKANGEMIIVR